MRCPYCRKNFDSPLEVSGAKLCPDCGCSLSGYVTGPTLYTPGRRLAVRIFSMLGIFYTWVAIGIMVDFTGLRIGKSSSDTMFWCCAITSLAMTILLSVRLMCGNNRERTWQIRLITILGLILEILFIAVFTVYGGRRRNIWNFESVADMLTTYAQVLVPMLLMQFCSNRDRKTPGVFAFILLGILAVVPFYWDEDNALFTLIFFGIPELLMLVPLYIWGISAEGRKAKS